MVSYPVCAALAATSNDLEHSTSSSTYQNLPFAGAQHAATSTGSRHSLSPASDESRYVFAARLYEY